MTTVKIHGYFRVSHHEKIRVLHLQKKLTSPLPSHFAAAFNQNLLHFHSLKITSIQIGVETHFFTSRWKLEVTLNRAALAYCVCKKVFQESFPQLTFEAQDCRRR